MASLSSFKSEEVLDENGNKAYYYDVSGTRYKEEDERIKKAFKRNEDLRCQKMVGMESWLKLKRQSEEIKKQSE